MATPLGRSNHPHCSAHIKPMHSKPPPSSVQHPKASMDVSLTHPSITAFPNSHRHHRQRYLCTCISEATPRLFSFCGGWANPLSRSYSRESAVDETAAFRVGTAQNQPQAGELLCFWALACSKIMSNSPIYCRLVSALHQMSPNSCSLRPRCYSINERTALPSHPPLPLQASDISNNEKNRIFYLRCYPRPLSSCSGATSLLLRSNGRECIRDETVPLERS